MNHQSLRDKSNLAACSCVLMIVFSATVDADDWPHWRGPDRNDRSAETRLLKKWPAGGPKQQWINQDAGLGYAGIAIVGDQLFTLGLEDGREFALCLNAETGDQIWRTPVASQYENRWGDGPRSTPSVDGDRVYAMFAGGTLACLNQQDGAVQWQVKMQDFGGKVPKWGYAESPLVDGDQVVVTPGGARGTMLALDKMTGDKIWQTKPIGGEEGPVRAHYSSIVPADINGTRQYVQLLESAIVGIDSQTGDVLWKSDWPGQTAVIPSPIVDGRQVYVTSGYSAGSKLIEIGRNNRVSEVWYSKAMQNHHGGVVQVGDYYYGSSAKAFVCQNKKTGQMEWAERNIKKGTVAYADGHFYHVQEIDGKVYLFEANASGAKPKGEFVLSPQTKRRKPSGRIWVHPVISDGKLYLRDQEIIYCYDIKR